ncbi:hypothetical protein ABB39_08670 [Levilactobacillus brevis]|uniref:DUF1064 domain-containing protein n=1 Tax=Levilactobacillus brevis TaxID=1580 RepID=UPI0007602491|nr:DUF1064 domain-containing protein [Levilactobacillus brevis]KWT47480.1 hypothetical protein ABB39_08670 [Levilactobacillus brevis]QWK86944.1 DUF1064 domain-containing protein [Levilactobacillus brevis]
MKSPTALNKRGTKVHLDGYVFDSQKEADFYMRFVRDSGLQYTIHPKYVLMPLTELGKVKASQISYKPDFVIYKNGKISHVYDVKNSFGVYGIDGSVKLRFKLFLLSQGIPVEAVVVRKHDFKVIAQGITKQRKPTHPLVCTNLLYDWIEATNL